MNRSYLFLILLFFGTTNAYATVDSLLLQQIEKADSLFNIWKSEEAITLLKKNRNLSFFSESTCDSKAKFYHKLGVYYYDLFQNEEALVYLQDSALQIRLTCLGPIHQETGNSYFAVAAAFENLGDLKQQGDHLLKSIEIFESLPKKDTIGLAYKYMLVGRLYDDLGDYQLAEEYLFHAQQYYKDLDIKWNRDVADLLISIGNLKSDQQEYQEAINYFQSAIKTYEHIKGRDHGEDIANCLLSLGKAFLYQKKFLESEKNAFKALEGYQKSSRNIVKVSNCYELLGNISKRRKDYDKALNYFKQSLQLRIKDSTPKKIANAYENKGDLFAEQNLYDPALKNYDTSISYLLPDFKQKFNPEEQPLQYELVIDKLDLLRVLSLKAETLLTRYKANEQQRDIIDAYSIHQQLDTLILRIRQEYKAPGSKFFLAQQTLPIYEKAVETALVLYEQTNDVHYLEEAYIYAAKNKAIVLLDGLQDLNAKFIGIPEDILAKEKILKKEYVELEGKIFTYINQEGQDSLLESNKYKFFETRRELEKLVNRLEKEYPNYYELKYAIPDLSTIKTLQDSLSANQAIIEYFVGNKKIFVFTILKNKINYNSILKPNDFDKNCEQFRKLSSGLIPFDEAAFRTSANTLTNLLLKNSLDAIDKKVSRLILIPDDLLLQFSFDNLFYEAANAGVSFPYLIKKYATSTIYSNQLLFKSDFLKHRNQPNKLFAGFGLEYNDYTLEGLELISSIRNGTNANSETGKLIYSDDEVQEIADFLKGKAWINKAATKNNFLKHSGDYKILHLAMHGIIDEQIPLNSSLIFFRDSDSTDFVLRASELYRLELNTKMVVLSACHTGAGKITRGEGVRSLARAFAYAGSPSLVASLWSASDYSTKEILVPFYKNLQEGMPKDIALQKAKLDYLERSPPSYAFPSYWSHLTVVGNTEPIVFNFSGKNWIPWMIVGIALMGLFFGRRFIHKNG